MGEGPSDEESALLARLNNLKKSNVSFNQSSTINATSVSNGQDETPEDLLARFQKLHRNGEKSGKILSTEGAVNNEYIGPPSPTVEELLAELGQEDKWNLKDTDIKEADDLMAEARRALPDAEIHTQVPQQEAPLTERGAFSVQSTDPTTKTEPDDETEAQASLQRILDEVEAEKQQAPPSPQNSPKPSQLSVPPDTFASLIFPPTPDYNLPLPAGTLDLPSVPTAAPMRKLKAKPKPIGYTDAEIDFWCTMCYANGTVKCFGCDGDLYCWGCWREGHVGEEVGAEEKSHEWERVKRRPRNK
ncbi:hypothetical protein MMC21_000531 [Puttea exsequens]|nr:hypothetical protein [Puttea exsequens]